MSIEWYIEHIGAIIISALLIYKEQYGYGFLLAFLALL